MADQVTTVRCDHVLSPDIVFHSCEHGLNVFAMRGIEAFVSFDEQESRSRTAADFSDYIVAQCRALDAMKKANAKLASPVIGGAR